MGEENAKKLTGNRASGFLSAFIFHIFDHIFHASGEQCTKVGDRVGRNAFTFFDGVVGGTVKTHFLQPVGCDPLFLHRSEKRFITHHVNVSPPFMN